MRIDFEDKSEVALQRMGLLVSNGHHEIWKKGRSFKI